MKKYIFFLIIFSHYFIFSIRLPLSSSFVDINSNNNKNLRNLLTQDLETSDYIYHILKTEVCIGVPPQCLKVAYDTGNTYLVVGLPKTSSQFDNNFNFSKSETFRSVLNSFYSHIDME